MTALDAAGAVTEVAARTETRARDAAAGLGIVDAYRLHVSVGRARFGDMTGGHVEVSSKGSRVRDAAGREFLDCGGYGVFILGHGHPAVVEAVVEQARRHPLATRLLLEPRIAEAAATLAAVTPHGLDYCHFVNSGAEATEAALKIARTKGRTRLVATHGGFHGKTFGALSVTAEPRYRDPFRPLLPEPVFVPYGDAAALADVLAAAPGECCVVVEPVQGEGGVVIPPDGYLSEVSDLCRLYDAMLVLDEIQTGLGRLGTWWGADREGVVPDVLLVGKGLSGGVVPVAAAVATADAYDVLNRDPFLHSSTFAGSPIAMAAASAAVRAIEDDGVVPRAAELGARLLEMLEEVLAPYRGDFVRDVRGRGLLLGVEFPEPHFAADMVLELLSRGVVTNHSLNAHRVLRLTPPAVLDDADVAWLTDATTAAVRASADRWARSPGRGEVLA